MKCIGCGIEIQTTDPNRPGYSPKEGAKYCQRCYQLTHYGKLAFSYKEDVSANHLFEKIRHLNALILWIVDLFDLESAFQQNLDQFFEGQDVLVVCTKRDLLPVSIGQDKLGNYLLDRLDKANIHVKGLVVVGEHGHDGKEDIKNAVEILRKGRDIVLVGNTNAGKSTILNNVFDIHDLTVSRYPGTTMDLIPMELEEYTLYDTPGFNQRNSVQILAEDKDMEQIIPKNTIRPIVYQLKDDQSLAIGGIMRVDLYGCEDVTVSAYFAEQLNVHRNKAQDADALWEKHFGELLVPTLKGEYFKTKKEYTKKYKKTDIAILGLGWLCVSGNYKKIVVSGSEEAEVVFRKAMI